MNDDIVKKNFVHFHFHIKHSWKNVAYFIPTFCHSNYINICKVEKLKNFHLKTNYHRPLPYLYLLLTLVTQNSHFKFCVGHFLFYVTTLTFFLFYSFKQLSILIIIFFFNNRFLLIMYKIESKTVEYRQKIP